MTYTTLNGELSRLGEETASRVDGETEARLQLQGDTRPDKL